jgi:hypothetical protein
VAQLRYDLAKLRAKRLVVKVPRSQTYRVTPQGVRICILFLKLAHRVYAPVAAAVLKPVRHDATLPANRRAQLDQLMPTSTRPWMPSLITWACPYNRLMAALSRPRVRRLHTARRYRFPEHRCRLLH